MTGSVTLCNGLVHRGGDIVTTNWDTDDNLTGSAHGGEILRTIKDKMGSSSEEQLVLVTGRLSLHAIDNHGSA
jgi:hypothetical protein